MSEQNQLRDFFSKEIKINFNQCFFYLAGDLPTSVNRSDSQIASQYLNYGAYEQSFSSCGVVSVI